MNLSAYRAQRRARAGKLASLPSAIAQTRHVYEGVKDAEGALDYLEAVLAAGHLSAANQPQARMDAGAKPATSGAAPAAQPLASLAKEVLSLSSKIQHPADLTVQLLVLEELRGLRAELVANLGNPPVALGEWVFAAGAPRPIWLARRPPAHMQSPEAQASSD